MFHLGCNSIFHGSESSEDEDAQVVNEQEENEEGDTLDEYGLGEKDRTYICSAFALLDRDGDGVISPRTMEYIITSLSREPTQENMDEIKGYCSNKGADEKPEMDFNGFYKFLATQLNNTDNILEVKNALEIFDAISPVDGSVLPGLTDLATLRHNLKHKGLKLTDEELDYLWEEEKNWMLEEKRIETDYLVNKIMERP